MKSVTRFSLVVALLTLGQFLNACSQAGTNSSSPSSPVATTASSPSAPQYPGAVDRSDCEAVSGWVVNRDQPDSETKVGFYVDDQLIETLPATTLRPDLTGWGSGRYGFTFRIPANLKDGKPHTIRIKIAGTAHEVPVLQNSSRFQCPAS